MAIINYIEIDVILDHISLMLAKNENFKVGIISEKLSLNKIFGDMIIQNLKLLQIPIISCRDNRINLSNESYVNFYSIHQDNSILRGLNFDIFVCTCCLTYDWEIFIRTLNIDSLYRAYEKIEEFNNAQNN
jgi:hypothetical protein